MTPTAATNKTCPQCGHTFTCTPHSCWCSELPPVMPMIDGAECLCPDCLRIAIAAKQGTT